MGEWLLGWTFAVYAAAPLVIENPSTWLALFFEVARVLSAYFLLKGTLGFFGKSLPKVYTRWAVATLVWVLAVVAISAVTDPGLLNLGRPEALPLLIPSHAFESIALIVTGRQFLLSTKLRKPGRRLAGTAYILLGLHVVDCVLLYPVPGMNRWTYTVAFLMGLVAALGGFVCYFDHRDQEARAEKDAREQAEAALISSEARYRELADMLPETVYEIDLHGNLLFGNINGFSKFGYTEEDFRQGLNIFDVIAPEQVKRARRNLTRMARGHLHPGAEYTAVRKDGTRFPMIVYANPIVRGDKTIGFRGIIVDITGIKSTQEKLRFISLHDPLTGLYNRTYFEQQVRRAEASHGRPAGIVVCDMDGLKLVNDTLGHTTGDKLLTVTGRIISGAFGRDDVIARVGGDEFAVLMLEPGPDPKASLDKACARLQERVDSYNARHPELPMSVSVGCAVSETSRDLSRLFKEADDNMYREKLHRSHSVRNSIVQTMMKTLEARDYATEHHGERLETLVTDLAQALEFPSQRMADLRLLAQFHDIGKVGIPDHILFKAGPLSFDEREEIRRHSEIGYRIAQAAPELVPISDWILKHHEWWDGRGYPLGLKGEEIPLECRILAVADAYDAMTSERPYRPRLTSREAVEEILRCAGTQFDPHLADVFARKVAQSLEMVAS